MTYHKSLGWPGQRPLAADPFSGAIPDWMRLLTPEAGGQGMAALAAKSQPPAQVPGSSIWDRILGVVGQGAQIGKNIAGGAAFPPAPGPVATFPGAQNYQEPTSVMPYVLLGGAALAAFFILRKKKG